MKKLFVSVLCAAILISAAVLPTFATNAWLEAEDYNTSNTVVENAKASGGKSVTVAEKGKITFNVDIDMSARYFVRVGHRAGNGNIVATIDGKEYSLGVGSAVYGTKWVIVSLSEGAHEISYTAEGGDIVIDYLSVYPYSDLPIGSDSPSGGYDNPYNNPGTSDISYIFYLIAAVCAVTAVGSLLTVKRKKS